MEFSSRLSTIALFLSAVVSGFAQAGGLPASRTIIFQAADGVELHAELFPTNRASAPVVLLFHQAGASGRAEYATIAPRLQKAGYNVFAFDQRSGGERFGGHNRTVDGLNGKKVPYCEAYPDLEAALSVPAGEGFDGPLFVWGSSYSAALVFKLAAQYPAEISGVLSFSTAAGSAMAGCRAEPYLEGLKVPAIAFRPASEMESPKVQRQAERFAEAGIEVVIVGGGVHGSSMLVHERCNCDVEPGWTDVMDFLATNTGGS